MKQFAVALALTAAALAPAFAQSSITRADRPRLIETYYAFIGKDDLYNSSGNRLTRPWQIIRQDRANFHSFGIRQRGDTSDSFFSDPVNRQRMEDLLASGSVRSDAGRMIVQGDVRVQVDIFGRGDRGEWVEISVLD